MEGLSRNSQIGSGDESCRGKKKLDAWTLHQKLQLTLLSVSCVQNLRAARRGVGIFRVCRIFQLFPSEPLFFRALVAVGTAPLSEVCTRYTQFNHNDFRGLYFCVTSRSNLDSRATGNTTTKRVERNNRSIFFGGCVDTEWSYSALTRRVKHRMKNQRLGGSWSRRGD